MAKKLSYITIFYMQEYCKSPPEANFGPCHRGSQRFFFCPAADLPIQPPVQHSNAETPCIFIYTQRACVDIRFMWQSITNYIYHACSSGISSPILRLRWWPQFFTHFDSIRNKIHNESHEHDGPGIVYEASDVVGGSADEELKLQMLSMLDWGQKY